MPAENTRMAVLGHARVDKEFSVIELSRESIRKMSADLDHDAERLNRELERIMRGPGE